MKSWKLSALAVALCGLALYGNRVTPVVMGRADRVAAVEAPAPKPTPHLKAPSIVPVGTVPVNQIVQIRFSELTADVARKSHIDYYPRPAGAVFFPAVGLNGDVVLFFSSPSAAKVLIWIDAPDEGGKVQHAETEVIVGKPSPEPDPAPDPTPEPTPTPTALWGAILIEESGSRTPELAALLTSQELSLYLTESKLSLRVGDKDEKDASDNPTPELKGWVARAAGSLPKLFIVGVDGSVVWEGEPPATSSALIALMRQKASGR